MSTEVDRLRFSIFGVPGASRNLGVGALRASAVAGLLRREPSAEVTVFDDGWGVRSDRLIVDGHEIPIRLCGARNSRRFHRRESFANMRLSARLRLPGSPGLATIDASDAVLDVSGGDSFSDIYGVTRFQTVALPKLLTLMRRRKLVLLPQTYGPFRDSRIRDRAAEFVRGSSLAWARDQHSFDVLRELAGDDFDPARFRLGVDMAFGLDAIRPEQLEGAMAAWLDATRPHGLVGLNFSGLLLHDPKAAERYGLRADYRAFAHRLVVRFLERTDARLLLVPHVLGSPDLVDSDAGVAESILAVLSDSDRERVKVGPPGLGAAETKWLISRTDWFCGTRMHSTIAGLSSGVPTAAVAYSGKAIGVFETCGLGHAVADARSLTTDDLVDRVWSLWEDRDEARSVLASHLPKTLARVESQMDEIVDSCRRWSGRLAIETGPE